MKYDLVIFDCDGTLVDSEPVTMRLICKMMQEMGIELAFNEALEDFAGKNMMHITTYMESQIGSFDKVAFEKDYRHRCIQVFKDELEIVPGVDDLIKQLPVPYCIASNGPKEKMDVTLSVTGLIDLFDPNHIFSAYDFQKWKPDPTLYQSVLAYFDCSPECAVVIEDTMPGIMGAVNAGIDTIAYNPKNEMELNQSEAKNFGSMREISNYLLSN